jgi:flagellar motility protein MotE (MotC chaperone)
MTRDEALQQIPAVLDELEALEQEKSDWMKEWRARRDEVLAALKHLRRIASGEETLEA